ncbi:MAG: 2Fe-2S iron-sulfur cluster-binding protein, partial [Verrucomicrobiales bacterium]|nr:2Fe-2S iron-sulfur cluster-binding protein [Verrucomicrobiales bacterium]
MLPRQPRNQPQQIGQKSITLTVDGKPVTVPEGTTVLQACEKARSPVPFYCYHPGLSIAGNCRICLVEIEGTPKLQISCYTRAAEGMKVNTTSDAALAGRRDVLEFLLINHPLDCPVCDQAGECWLQDYYMQHGLYDPKFNEQKVKKTKAVPIGPTVMLDAERCILCSRCVRFTDEVTKTGEFGIFNRGDHAEVGLHPGKTLENNYAGNVVDICPVGALTDRDFRFKCRVWYLGSTKSVCPGCSRGCNVEIHYNRERDWRPHIAEGQ